MCNGEKYSVSRNDKEIDELLDLCQKAIARKESTSTKEQISFIYGIITGIEWLINYYKANPLILYSYNIVYIARIKEKTCLILDIYV